MELKVAARKAVAGRRSSNMNIQQLVDAINGNSRESDDLLNDKHFSFYPISKLCC